MSFEPSKEVLELRESVASDLQTGEMRLQSMPVGLRMREYVVESNRQLKILLQCLDLVIEGATEANWSKVYDPDLDGIVTYSNLSVEDFQNALTIKDE